MASILKGVKINICSLRVVSYMGGGGGTLLNEHNPDFSYDV